jgi:DNA-binding beta-propeller fold protein YncE
MFRLYWNILSFLLLFNPWVLSHEDTFSQSLSTEKRELYATPPAGKIYKLETIFQIPNPTGVASGFFRDEYGVFVSTAAYDVIFFIDSLSLTSTLVAGIVGFQGTKDGNFHSATFSDPTRMAYDDNYGRLYVADRNRSGLRRSELKSSRV